MYLQTFKTNYATIFILMCMVAKIFVSLYITLLSPLNTINVTMNKPNLYIVRKIILYIHYTFSYIKMTYFDNFKNYLGAYFTLFCFVFNRLFELKGIWNSEATNFNV